MRLRTDEGSGILAEVEDDGRGFDPGSVRAGVGLSAMRERVEGLGGEIEVRSRPGEGTKVYGQGSLGGRYSSSSTSMTPSLHGVDHRLGPVEDVQLPVDVGGVVPDRLLRDAQRLGLSACRSCPGQGPL